MKSFINFIGLALSAFVFVAFAEAKESSSKIYIEAGKAKIKKSLLAFPPLLFLGANTSSKNLTVGKNIFQVAYNDLAVSSLFQIINQNAYLEKPSEIGLRPAPGAPNGFHYPKWKAIGTEFLIRAGYKVVNKQIQLDGYLYYVPKAQLVLAKSYKGDFSDYRTIAHRFSGDIYEKLTGRKSFFETKMVVSSTRGNGRHKEIFIMDWDGQNAQQITTHRSLAISPAWSPDGSKIAYSAIVYHQKSKRRNHDIFLYDIKKRNRWLVSYRKGLNSGAAFMPNGKELLLTLSLEKNPDIFMMNVDGSKIKRLTKGPSGALNVEPVPSPDGKKIAFSSTRGGRPAIYTMNRWGANVRRITHKNHKYNSSPAWSPDGKWIAFAGQDKSHFDIFLMKSNGLEMKRLTSAKKKDGSWSNNEDPSFSPDGRHIMFTSDRTGSRQIYIVDIEGTNERRITFDKYNYERPKWSPFLK